MNQNPTDSQGRRMDEGADYYINDKNPNVEYKGQFNVQILGWSLKFATPGNEKIVYRPVNYHAVRLEGLAGIRDKSKSKSKSKSKRRKTKRRRSRKNKSRRRR